MEIPPSDKPAYEHCKPVNCTFNSSTNPITTKELLETVKNTVYIYSISLPLIHVFNCSISAGVVPDKIKIVKIIPIFKSGDSSNVDNYRPITLRSSFSKVLEKLMAYRLFNYLETNSIINNFQFGFWKSHSTHHAMVHLLNKLPTSLNDETFSAIIFCDLNKASFNTCDHKILAKKVLKIVSKTHYLNGSKVTSTTENNLFRSKTSNHHYI